MPLVPALYPECAELGERVQQYLSSGDAGGDAEVEQQLADDRAGILASPEEAQAGLIRARASDVIERCDQQRSDEDARQALAEQEAREQLERDAAEAAAAEREAAREAQFADSCTQLGGRIDAGGWCLIDYPGWPDEVIPLLEDGRLDEEQAGYNEEDCALAAEDARLSAEEGYPWQELPVFHVDTGVCLFGSP